MVNKEENVVDLVFKHKLEQQAKIKKARARKRRRKFTFIFLIGLFIFVYYSTEISKPKNITISGNYILSKDEILEKSEVDLNSMLLYANPVLISKRLNSHPLIEKVKVDWSLIKRVINIKVSEVQVFGYRQDSDKAEMLMLDGSHIELTPDFYKFMPHLIYIDGFSEVEAEKRLIEAFLNLDQQVINQISEIHQRKVSFDDYYIEVKMNDGNTVYTSYQTVSQLAYYFDIIVNLKSSNTCIIIDEMSGEAYSQRCEDIKLSE